MMNRIWNDESGVLTFEWILLLTLLVIGIVGGLAAVRDAYIIELSSAANAITSLDMGYSITCPVLVSINSTANGAAATDTTLKALKATLSSTAAGTLSLDRNTVYTFTAGVLDTTENTKTVKTGAPSAGFTVAAPTAPTAPAAG